MAWSCGLLESAFTAAATQGKSGLTISIPYGEANCPSRSRSDSAWCRVNGEKSSRKMLKTAGGHQSQNLRCSSHLQNVSFAIDIDGEFSSQHIEPFIVA
jgi:hypothetical protein